jgi:hypothetical protein
MNTEKLDWVEVPALLGIELSTEDVEFLGDDLEEYKSYFKFNGMLFTLDEFTHSDSEGIDGVMGLTNTSAIAARFTNDIDESLEFALVY